MKREGEVAAVVVSHQSASTIGDCVARLLVCERVGAVVVVDNASTDGTQEIVRTLLDADPRLSLVCNDDNPGFGTACNQGAARTDCTWLALVNPDCLLEPDDLVRLIAHAESLPDAGLLGTTQFDAQGHEDAATRRRDPSLDRLLAGRGRRDSLTIERNPALVLQPVDAVSGALMLMPRALFEVLGGFDEGYRLHAEDLDLCRRVRQAGQGVYVANDIRVLHLRGVSSRARPLWVEWQKHRGLWRYLGKFELGTAPLHRRLLGWAVVWGHFAAVAPRLWWQARRNTAQARAAATP